MSEQPAGVPGLSIGDLIAQIRQFAEGGGAHGANVSRQLGVEVEIPEYGIIRPLRHVAVSYRDGRFVLSLRSASTDDLAAAGSQQPDRQVEAVLDLLAPKAEAPPGFAAARCPIIRAEHGGQMVMPTDEQMRSLAQQIVTIARSVRP